MNLIDLLFRHQYEAHYQNSAHGSNILTCPRLLGALCSFERLLRCYCAFETSKDILVYKKFDIFIILV